MVKKKIISYSILIGLLILFIVGGIIFYYNQTSQSIVNTGTWRFFSFGISDTQNYATVSLSAKTDTGNTFENAASREVSEIKINEQITWKDGVNNYAETGKGIDIEIPSNVQFNKIFQTDDVSISGAFGAYRPATGYSDRGAVTVNYKNLHANCSASNKDSITCQITGIAFNPDGKSISERLIGQPEVKLNVDLLKEGVECLDNSYCSTTQICENLICKGIGSCPQLNTLNCNEGYKELVYEDAEGCQINECVLEENYNQTKIEREQQKEKGESSTQINYSWIWWIIGILALIFIIMLIILLIRGK